MPNALVTDVTVRRCSRCALPLTDPASRECGQGPICRRQDTHLYAKTIVANLPVASAIVLGTEADVFPLEAQDRWNVFKGRFLRKMKEASCVETFQYDGADFRDCVRDLDYILSFYMSSNLQNRIVEIVKNLGYPGLAAVLAGEASVSKARVWFQDGRLFLEGKSCQSGYRAMRRIPGIKTPARRGDRTPYSAPATQVEAFLSAVQSYWPLYEGDFADLRQQAAQYTASNPVQQIAEVAQTKAVLRVRSQDFTLSFPWVRSAPMNLLLTRLKAVTASERSYDPVTKTWSFKKSHYDFVRSSLGIIFVEADIVSIDTDETTPEGVYRSYAQRGANPTQGQYASYNAYPRRYRRRY